MSRVATDDNALSETPICEGSGRIHGLAKVLDFRLGRINIGLG